MRPGRLPLKNGRDQSPLPKGQKGDRHEHASRPQTMDPPPGLRNGTPSGRSLPEGLPGDEPRRPLPEAFCQRRRAAGPPADSRSEPNSPPSLTPVTWVRELRRGGGTPGPRSGRPIQRSARTTAFLAGSPAPGRRQSGAPGPSRFLRRPNLPALGFSLQDERRISRIARGTVQSLGP